MIWYLTGIDSSLWQFKDTFIHSNRQGLISFLCAKRVAKRNDITEKCSWFSTWMLNPCAREGTLKVYQWPQEKTEPHFAWMGPWQMQNTQGQCFSNPSAYKLFVWSNVHSEGLGLEFLTCFQVLLFQLGRTDHTEYQASRQCVFEHFPWHFSAFLFSKASTQQCSDLSTLSVRYCPLLAFIILYLSCIWFLRRPALSRPQYCKRKVVNLLVWYINSCFFKLWFILGISNWSRGSERKILEQRWGISLESLNSN